MDQSCPPTADCQAHRCRRGTRRVKCPWPPLKEMLCHSADSPDVPARLAVSLAGALDYGGREAMRGLAGLLLLLAVGCSTAPVADVLDFACPPQMPPPNAPSFGGVGIPQSAPPAAAIVQP